MNTLTMTLGLIAVCGAVVWFRTGWDRPATASRGRLREVAWCAALLIVVLAIATSLDTSGAWRAGSVFLSQPAIVAVLLGAGFLVVLLPRMAFGLLPASLIFLGGWGFVAARDYGFWGFQGGNYAFLPLNRYDLTYYLVLPLAYGLLALGGWLTWRAIDREAPLARLALGPLGRLDRPAQRWSFLLLPVVLMTGALLIPGVWFNGGVAGTTLTLVIVAAACGVIRRFPDRAAVLATAGVLALGVTSLVLAAIWQNWPLSKTGEGNVLDGFVSVSSFSTADLAIGQGIALIAAALWLLPRTSPPVRRLLGWASPGELTLRVQRLTETRAEAVDTAAADLRRLERDLHDGAQARLVALGMNLRVVERLIPTSPEAALALVAEARETSARALTELRELVRGVHPPVLADRGLGDAVRALALDTPLKIETEIDLPDRLPAPVETACYFAVAELLTNAVKHSGARSGRISAAQEGGRLRITVTDFGLGGADPARGTGLAGAERRLASFDGIVAVSSPVGGPTMVVLEVPCASSSPKIFSC